jgi:hypothetical protein
MASKAIVVGTRDGNNVLIKKEVAGGTVKAGDLVTAKTNGKYQVAAAGAPIAGVAINDAVDTGVLNIQTGIGLRILMQNDNVGTTFAATHKNAFFDITGGSTAQLVDTSTVLQAGDGTDSGQLKCVEYNPQGYGYDSDTTMGLFEVNEKQ